MLRTWHVLDNGVAPQAGTLLCVHGNPTWSYLWRRFLSCADPGWRVVAVDQLGMGYSERRNVPRTLAARIDDLDAITSELGITGHVVLAAHDWGGPISLGWAQRHLDQITGLILTNTGVAVPPDTDPPAADPTGAQPRATRAGLRTHGDVRTGRSSAVPAANPGRDSSRAASPVLRPSTTAGASVSSWPISRWSRTIPAVPRSTALRSG